MKMSRRLWRYAAVVAVCGALSAGAEEKALLKIGDPAPALKPSGWLQGEAVGGFETGKVYVVEFWASWCGPCRASIPHVNELQEKHKDHGLIVIGQNVSENKAPEELAKFVKGLGDQMRYRVALDAEGAMKRTWMEAAGAQGIPTAFVVDKAGRIAWIGHPMAGLDQVVEEVLAGTFDPQKAAAEQEAAEKEMAKVADFAREFGGLTQEGKWDEAIKLLDRMSQTMSSEERAGMDYLKVGLLLSKKDYARAESLARKLSDGEADPMMLNELAWWLVTTESAPEPLLQLSEAVARKALTVGETNNPAVLDTLARALFRQNKQEEALRLQEQAVAGASEAEMKAQMQATLEAYKKGRLPDAE